MHMYFHSLSPFRSSITSGSNIRPDIRISPPLLPQLYFYILNAVVEDVRTPREQVSSIKYIIFLKDDLIFILRMSEFH